MFKQRVKSKEADCVDVNNSCFIFTQVKEAVNVRLCSKCVISFFYCSIAGGGRSYRFKMAAVGLSL